VKSTEQLRLSGEAGSDAMCCWVEEDEEVGAQSLLKLEDCIVSTCEIEEKG